ncbi:pyridoxal phosphate phosphatase PHOSPHO2 isoform X3 [Neopsephotus bourkii]|uniref:pyridoxal phosphate phosphatase PHOSPHO2 isoform X3 n=1 Tax=Neopsephotus bourkii TaxID=309878 RepID=UPI002AA583A6|nr:pyridoxal phosphate phosphatase PHOSPHO2 isoform X3 [Neopsephotus bourkii]
MWRRGLLAESWPDRRPGLRRRGPCGRTGLWGNGVKFQMRYFLFPGVSVAQRCAAAMKFLLAFDFDHTIIDENSDTWIVKCAPEKKLPNGLRNSYRPGHWTEYMGRVFVYLGDNGVKEDVMKRTMTTIPFTAGMVDLLGFIGENKELFDCIIVSDSNTVFIDWILKAADFHKVFDEVFTNPAAFSSTGYLTVQDFHAHHCAKCPKNLCKREVLKEFLDKQLDQGVCC